jgi:hypothetical protein
MRVIAVTLCYNKPEIIDLSIRRFHETKHGGLPLVHLMIDQHYPLPDKLRVSEQIKKIASDNGCEYMSPGKNLGLHHGLNWALQTYGLAEDDIVIGYDGDSYPCERGWDMALVTALMADASTVWASLWGVNTSAELNARGFTERMAAQVRVRETHTPAVNSVCAWKGWWIKNAGWFNEPHEFYGGLEIAMWPHIRAKGYRWVYLPDWTEDERLKFNPGEDLLYKQWKWDHVMLGKNLDFETWLRNSGHIA